MKNLRARRRADVAPRLEELPSGLPNKEWERWRRRTTRHERKTHNEAGAGTDRAKAAEEVRLTGKARSHNEEGERRHEGAQRGVLVELLEHEPEDSRRGGRWESRRPTGRCRIL